MEGLRGIYSILATPFMPDNALDLSSLRRLARFQVEAGVDGVTVLGILGEAHKLTESERRTVIEAVVQEIGGRIPVVVGTSAPATDLAIRASVEAAEIGATAVMVAPPTNLRGLDAVREYYQRVHAAVDLPLVVQDEPTFSNVIMPAPYLASLCDTLPRARTIKLEEWPSPLKTSQVLRAAQRPLTVLGGMGGVYFYEELARGAAGTMTGFAFPEILVAIYRMFQAGDRNGARRLFYQYVPLIRFEGQQGIGLAIRKETLRRRGLIDRAAMRHPAIPLDEDSARELTEILDALALTSRLARVIDVETTVTA